MGVELHHFKTALHGDVLARLQVAQHVGIGDEHIAAELIGTASAGNVAELPLTGRGRPLQLAAEPLILRVESKPLGRLLGGSEFTPRDRRLRGPDRGLGLIVAEPLLSLD